MMASVAQMCDARLHSTIDYVSLFDASSNRSDAQRELVGTGSVSS